MSKKSKKEHESMIEEINLNELEFEEEPKAKLEPDEDDLWEEEINWDDDKLEK